MTSEHWLWHYRRVTRKLRHVRVKGVPVAGAGLGNHAGRYSSSFPKHWDCIGGCDVCYGSRTKRERRARKVEDAAY